MNERAAFALSALLTACAGQRSGGTNCHEADAIATRRTALARDDEQALARAVHDTQQRAALTNVPLESSRRVGEPQRTTMDPPPLEQGVEVVASRPLDPAQPEGAVIQTRTRPGGSTVVVLQPPMTISGWCGEWPAPQDTYRFARAANGSIVPIHVVFRTESVPVRVCGCVTGGCGTSQGRTSAVDEFVLPVSDASEVIAPREIRVTRHELVVTGNQRCGEVP